MVLLALGRKDGRSPYIYCQLIAIDIILFIKPCERVSIGRQEGRVGCLGRGLLCISRAALAQQAYHFHTDDAVTLFSSSLCEAK